MKKIKLFGILTFLLMGIAVPQNEMLKVDAATNDTELLSYVYDLFADENIVEYDDINYFMSVPEEGILQYDVNCPLNTRFGATIGDGIYSRQYYYSWLDGNINENLIDDVLFNNFWNFSRNRLTLEDTFTLDSQYDSNIDEWESLYRNFDFGGNSQTNPQFWYENNTASSKLSKEQLVVNPGIKFEGYDEEGLSVFKKKSWASLGGVSLLQQTMYLNSSFDESLKESNNFEIALFDSLEWGYGFEEFVEYNQVLAGFFDKGTFYNYPLIEVNGKPFIYVVFEGTGGDTDTRVLPHIVCINSKFRMNYVLDNFGMYLSIPYHDYIETISYTLPYYTSTYCWDVAKQYCDESFDAFYDNNILKEVPGFMSFVPYWWNDDTLDKVKNKVNYHPLSVNGIDADNNQITFKCFTSRELVGYTYDNLYFEDFILRDISDSSSSICVVNDIPIESSYDNGAYVYLSYDIVSGLPKPGQSKTYELANVEFNEEYPLFYDHDLEEVYYINPPVYHNDKSPYSKQLKFKKNRTKQRVYFDAYVSSASLFRTLWCPITYTSVNLNFYNDYFNTEKINGIDSISLTVKIGSKDSIVRTARFSSEDNEAVYKQRYGYYYPRLLCPKGSNEGLISYDKSNFFETSYKYKRSDNKIKDFDFSLIHEINYYHYNKCIYVDVYNAYCDFWIGEDSYILGCTGDLGVSAEYDENGEFIGITDINGDILPGYTMDGYGNIYNPNGTLYSDDSSKVSYNSSYFGKYMDGLFDDFKSGFKSAFSLDGNFGKILSVIGILAVIVIIVKLYPLIKKLLSKNKKKRV